MTDAIGRRTHFSFDLAGRQLTEIRGYGSPDEADYATYTYSPNSQRITVKDANSNLSTLEYDGFDRLSKLRFPVPALGANSSSTTDFEQYTYNENGNRTSLRKRDAQVIGYTFDNLNRQSVKDLPGGTANDVYLDYDLTGRPEFAHLGGPSAAGIDYVYGDTAKRLTSEVSFDRALTFQLDANGNRTRLTWPDANYLQCDYDPPDRVTAVRENGATSGVGVLATYVYDPLSRRSSITRGNAANCSFGFSSDQGHFRLPRASYRESYC